ncbi:MAG: MoaD/ThiS family protein [Gammaproteobacteria bacterium]
MLFFARLREQVGKDQIVLSAAGLESVADVWSRAAGGPMPANTLAAVNHEHVGADHPVRDGDEVAFFPPITGG